VGWRNGALVDASLLTTGARPEAVATALFAPVVLALSSHLSRAVCELTDAAAIAMDDEERSDAVVRSLLLCAMHDSEPATPRRGP